MGISPMNPDLVSSFPVSGQRFCVLYRLSGNGEEARAKARDICLEQTVELPDALIPGGMIRDHILGRVERFEAGSDGECTAEISYPAEIVGRELTQLLNVIFGNISIKPGIRVERLALPDEVLRSFNGPRFGRQGLREYLRVPDRPLLCTALKPLGLSAHGLADLAYQCAMGGIDIIKDDHGLADQGFADFHERVRLCAGAVERANRESGQHGIYVPNVTAPADVIRRRARFAKEHGAGGLLIAPGLTGLDSMRCLAEDATLSLPIFSHPAFQGTYVVSREHGISHEVLFGQLPRLAGADATIYPSFGGRFSFTRAECQSIVRGTQMALGAVRTIFPCPGGGMNLERVPEMLDVYGRDVVLLIGGGLMAQGADLIENCRHFRTLIATKQG
jgi:ribulose-bisphosphate carboxylase large chain